MPRETKDTLKAEINRLTTEKKQEQETLSATQSELERDRQITLGLQRDFIETATLVGTLQVENQNLVDDNKRLADDLENTETWLNSAADMLRYTNSILTTIVAYKGPDPLVPRQLANVVLEEAERVAQEDETTDEKVAISFDIGLTEAVRDLFHGVQS